MLILFAIVIFLSVISNTSLSNSQRIVHSKRVHIKACPSLTIEKEGRIASPLFNSYPPYFYCHYEIKAPKGKRVSLYFMDFYLPSRSKVLAKSAGQYALLCEKNFLEVKAKNISHNGIRYCGDELNQKRITSEISTLNLAFQSMPFPPQGKNYVPMGFQAMVQFQNLSSKNAYYPCGSLLASDTSFVLRNKLLPCEIVIGAPGTSKEKVVLNLLSQNTSNTDCSVTLKFNVQQQGFQEVTSKCNSFVQIPENCVSILITKLTNTLSLEMELVFSERKTKIVEYNEDCGGSRRLELDKTLKITLPIKKRSDLRCMWIFEAPKKTKKIEWTSSTIKPENNFHLFDMLLSPSDTMFELMTSEIANSTYKDNHFHSAFPVKRSYYFSSIETEKVMMLFLNIGGDNQQQFEASVTAFEN